MKNLISALLRPYDSRGFGSFNILLYLFVWAVAGLTVGTLAFGGTTPVLIVSVAFAYLLPFVAGLVFEKQLS